MPMREECKHYESRTYDTGDTMRSCALDLAPEAPWRCPEGCKAFEPRLADVDWAHGTLVSAPAPPEPEDLGTPGADEALEEAEEIVNEAAPAVLAEVGEADGSDRGGRPSIWNRLRGRRKG
ncbi:MAG: hypothetical protein ACYDAD_07400 [Acidimicrobiales bacterium]